MLLLLALFTSISPFVAKIDLSRLGEESSLRVGWREALVLGAEKLVPNRSVEPPKLSFGKRGGLLRSERAIYNNRFFADKTDD